MTMATKTYIGHGTATQLEGVTDVVISMEKAQPFIFTYEGKQYLKFSVANRREADQFGHTHTVSCFTPEAKAEEQPKPKRSRKK